KLLCPFQFISGEWFCKRRQVLSEREQYRACEMRPLDDFDLQVHDAGDICRMPGNFTIPLHCMHIPEIYSAPRNFYRTDQHGTFPDTVYVHMAIGAFFKLLFGHAVVVRSVDQELSEVPGIMGVGEGTGRRGPQLAEEWDDPCHGTDDVMRCESHYGMLYGIFRSAHVFLAFPGDDL